MGEGQQAVHNISRSSEPTHACCVLAAVPQAGQCLNHWFIGLRWVDGVVAGMQVLNMYSRAEQLDVLHLTWAAAYVHKQ